MPTEETHICGLLSPLNVSRLGGYTAGAAWSGRRAKGGVCGDLILVNKAHGAAPNAAE